MLISTTERFDVFTQVHMHQVTRHLIEHCNIVRMIEGPQTQFPALGVKGA